MTHSSLDFHLAPEYEAFLFAPIGEDGHGMLLSVLSALARLNVDPWQEAAKLAGLPVNSATQRLASLIAALPDGPSEHRDAGTIAARLIALLPRPSRSESPESPNGPERAAALGIKTVVGQSQVILLVVFMVLALGAQFVAASHQPPAPVDNALAPPSSTVSPPISPPRTDR